MKLFNLSTSASVLALLAAPALAVEVQPIGTGRPDHQLIYEVIEDGLSALGHESAEMQIGAYPAIHLAVAQGDADYTGVHWMPLHNDYYENSGGDDVLVRAGPTYTGAMQGYYIDMATAQAHGITDLMQMADPEISALFDTDGDGMANLTGCNPGWGCEQVIEHQLDAFDLRDHINHDKGAYFALIADTIERYQSGESVFYTTWSPNWINSVMVPGQDVVFLDVPFSSLPGVDDADTALPDGHNPGFASNDNYILVNRDFAEANPDIMAFFEGLRIPLEDLNQMMTRVHDGEDSPAQIEAVARDWIADNQEAFDALIETARAAGN